MRQVVVIHGGHVFSSHEEFLSYLRNYTIESLEHFKRKDWKSSLEKELEGRYEIILPKMPCKDNAKYLEWKIWFEKILPFLQDDVVLIGHSLGGKFLAKYLSEEKFPVRVGSTILIAAPFEQSTRKYADFVLNDPLTLLEQQVGKIFSITAKTTPSSPSPNSRNIRRRSRARPRASSTTVATLIKKLSPNLSWILKVFNAYSYILWTSDIHKNRWG